nr:unnamed protein product [Callosobruchus analis]
MNSTTDEEEFKPAKLNVYYAACEILVAVFAVVGNALVIFVFRKERRLRRRTNYYIVSLATADLLVGLLGIPFAILSSVGLPTNLHACLFTVSLLVVLCTISIFCLVAVSVDRYWAILYPMGYSRNVRTKTALDVTNDDEVTDNGPETERQQNENEDDEIILALLKLPVKTKISET